MSASSSYLSSSGYLSEATTPAIGDGYADTPVGSSSPRVARVLEASMGSASAGSTGYSDSLISSPREAIAVEMPRPAPRVRRRHLDDFLPPNRVFVVRRILSESGDKEGLLAADMDLFRIGGRVFLGLGERLGQGNDKDVFKAIEINPATFECREVAQYNYKGEPDTREDALLEEARSPHVVEPTIGTYRCMDGKVIAFAPIYGSTLEVGFALFNGHSEDQLHLLRDGARGLAYLHAKGIIHRDVKSDNFLTDGMFHLRVADLGRSHRSGSLEEGTQRGHVLTFAPEGCTDAPVHDEKGDVWAFGKMAYELVSGSTFPLTENLKGDALERREAYMRRLASATQAEVYGGLKPIDARVMRVVQGCLAVDPAVRWTMERVAGELDVASHAC